ncbi:class I adenylate-forming enzyme family protein [Cohnella lubricantis]|uniref:Acyl--CoA ligase n=1 Tax=Cohnella lubricantis TaxID=2163172 RepID=A0A841T886_9BACL|nr:class I adenylate-forming enzyme family protein [Cohnella lubricantis]MBB6676299.1 acyl--CoA ligase [Cohnella lubricantis]MBP2119631.1 acyl-CoA synthetase (AMP-forming)/AMP-acid ligase II [Cohnella lubricantis]
MFDFEGRTLSLERAQAYLDQGVWTNESAVDLLKQSVDKYPDLVHKDETRSLTYRELWNEVETFAASLYELGIRRGDRVAIQLPNVLDYLVAVFGAARIGAVIVCQQIDLGRDAIVRSLEQSGAKIWILSENYRGQSLYEMALEVRESVPALERIVLQGEEAQPKGDTITFASLRDGSKKLPDDVLEANKAQPLDGYLMVFTSGTTGSPKGVVHLHASYIWALRAYAKNFGFQPGDTVLDIAPIYHQTGMLGVQMSIVTGCRIVLVDRFSARQVLQKVEAEKANFLVGAPPHVIHVANAPNLKSADTSSIKLFIYAGAPVPSAVLQRLQADGGFKVAAMFGWTEGLVVVATRPDDTLEIISSTIGSQIPGVEIKLMDEDGNEIAETGVEGEMWARGPNFSAGYFRNKVAAERQYDADGWFHSGDLLRKNANGRYSFVARVDDVINRGGTKIDPKGVEDVIAEHPSVQMIAVVAAPHDTLGQQIAACAVLKEDAPAFTLPELRDFLGERGLAKFQFPDLLHLVPELPMTNTGKIRKVALRDWLANGAEGLPTN